MKHRVLKRKVIIREYDFKRVEEQALGQHYAGMALYDRVSFIPLNEDSLEKLKLQEILRGKTGPLTEIDPDLAWSKPLRLVHQLRDYLYDKRYYEWRVTTDQEGYICVQARKNTPKSRLGWGVFEKDVKCRI
jgi:hypothetical protein